MGLAEALFLPFFATLEGGNDAAADSIAMRADPVGRSIMCAPAILAAFDTAQQEQQQQLSPAGILFRIGGCNGNNATVEAVQLTPPTLSAGQDEVEEGQMEGGGMKIIGSSFLCSKRVVRMACSDDARLLLIAYSDGTVVCLNVLLLGNGSELAIQFEQRWEVATVDGDGGSVVQFRTLEFLHGEQLHRFLAVVETSNDQTQTLWVDAALSTTTPPSVNLWPLHADNGVITCSTSCPSASSASNTTIAFGTNKGTLGIITTSPQTGV